MLKSLYIENIAIIEKASLDFERGFVVLSGETGAGKSIIIDAINGIMGGRTSRDLIRTNAKKASVVASFEDIAVGALKELEKLGVEYCDGQIVLQRDMMTDGKNNCRINGKPCTTQTLKDVSKYLITIHGQHDGALLLDEETHLDYLDSFARNNHILNEYLTEYEELLKQNRRIKGLSMSIKQREDRIEQLNRNINAMSELQPQKGEFENLMLLRSSMLGMQTITDAVDFSENALENDEGGILSILHEVHEKLFKAEKYNSSVAKISEKIIEALESLEDARGYMEGVKDSLDSFTMTYSQVEEKLELYENLAKKFNCQEDMLKDIYDGLLKELDELMFDSDEDISELKEKYVKQRNITLQKAEKLRKSREDGAKRLKTAIEAELAYLDMKSAKIEIEFISFGGEQVKFTKKGIDSVRFLLSANVGENYKPLSKVASGGELSRIMLAIKNVLSQNDVVETMIFDEVDTGVSGRAANKVGEKLWSIASRKQVLCVTHLPQIAAFADSHYRVSKATESNMTLTHIENLSQSGKAQEIARLTGGRDITELTMKSANEMIVMANIFKEQHTSHV